MTELPFEIYIVIVFIFGIVIGSFLNVVIYRLHTGKSLNDRSHCLSCGKGLYWYELFPLLSYLLLRGRCSGCSSLIPSRYFLVELLTGLAFVVVAMYTRQQPLMVLLLILVSVLVVGAVYDLYHMIIPDEVVIASSVLAVLVALVEMNSISAASISEVVLAGTIAATAYGALWWYSSGRWIGFGDVKLAFPFGMLVGLGGIFTMVVLSFWAGAVISLFILVVQYLKYRYQYVKDRMLNNKNAGDDTPSRCSSTGVEKYQRYFTMKSEIPFAPFLIVAFILTFFYGVDVLQLTQYAINQIYFSL